MKAWLALLATLTLPLSAQEYDPNALFAIEGLKVGQISDQKGLTGVTVLRFDQGATASVDVRGAAPGTRETDLLKPENLVDKVHAIVLSGGSAFGLDAMSGVARQLESEGIGFNTGVARVPIVTGAVLFDLVVGDPKARPDSAMGQAAAKVAKRDGLTEGNVGAGTGASVGKIRGMDHATKSGLGVYSVQLDSGLVVGAIVAVNAWGDVYDRDGEILAGTRDDNGFIPGTALIFQGANEPGFVGKNTTIGAIVTNATLTKAEALKVAQMAHDGYARAIRPVHTMNDGDAIFAAGTGALGPVNINTLGVIAAEVMETAIHRAVQSAEAAGGLPAARDISGE
ncbi:P1 family peptidase [Ferrimonas balearica]|uniref:P1 family peptidase n=1 Tax=Ferrimonas balearica TaxID=44012 RepID=UPI001C99A9CD|nr:P1 family peptidase [Ferrimonas balearica]MBY5923278.1 P1 family peptidase [Ferrimonas balearica]MBY5995236.1 P1 family peptidase [Ferrimonas balearica]